MAEQRARNSMPAGIYDSLPQEVKDSLINTFQHIINQEQQLQEQEHLEKQKQDLERREKQLETSKQQLETSKQQLESSKQQLESSKQQLEIGRSDLDHLARHLYHIDELTPSINDLQPTRSKQLLATTREYKEVAGPVLEQMNEGIITPREGKERTVEKMNELIRAMDARRQRERYASGKTIKKTVEQDQSHAKKKASDQSSFSIDECSDTNLVDYVTLAVVIPSQEELEKRIMEQQQTCLGRVQDHTGIIHSNSITLFLRGNRFFHSYTRNMITVDPRGNLLHGWYDKLYKNVEDKLKCIVESDNYEEEGLEISVIAVHLYYHLHRIECVDNWFTTKPNKYIEYKNFTLFTANDVNVPCIQQVVEHFNEVYDPSQPLEDMLAPRKVIYGHPATGFIEQVSKYEDLVWDYHEDVATTDCDNIARIVKWKGHIGIITKIKPSTNKYLNKMTRKAISIKQDSNVIDIFVDIEAFASTTPGKYLLSTPYLICWSASDNNTVQHCKGPGCVEQFVIKLLESYSDCTVCLYAWYGSGFDYQHIYKHLKNRCSEDTTFVKNNTIMYSKLKFNNNVIIHLKDPYLFILSSLDNAAKAFGVLNKGSFPHEIIKDWGDLDKIISDWYIVRSEPVEMIDGKKMLITAKNYDDIVERNNLKTVMEKALEYCTIDVIAMQEIWKKFTRLVKKQLQLSIEPNTFTLSQMSMKLMIAALPPKIFLSVPDIDEYEFIKRGMYGGRVQANNGIYEEDIYYADVVSLYPSAMRLLEHPIGDPTYVTEINWNKLGIYEVTLLCNKKPKEYKKFLPFRDINGKLSYKWRRHWEGVYHTYDLLIAKDQGYNITCQQGYEWNKGFIFNNFVDNLFKLKAENTGPVKNIAKIALNGGGYGKFVQKPINTNVHIVQKGIVQAHFDRLEANSQGMIIKGGVMIERPDFYELDEEWDKMIIEDPLSVPHYAVQVGISILSGSRYRLYKLCQQFTGMEVIYSDTDSIFVKASSVDRELWLSKMGTDLGQLDDTIGSTKHGIINRMYIAGPKMYAYEYHNDKGVPQAVCHMKGVRTSDLKLEHFRHLLGDINNKLVYNMMVLNKKMVQVEINSIAKEIKQT